MNKKKSRLTELAILMKEDYEKRSRNKLSIQEAKENEYNENCISEYQKILNLQNKQRKEQQAKAQFPNIVRESLLKEAILYLYNESLITKLETPNSNAIKRNLVNTFVQEEGAIELLSKFKRNSYILAEYADIIEEYTQKILSEAKKTNNYENMSNLSDKDDFYEELKLDDIDKVTDLIRERVSNSLDEFVTSNNSDRAKVKETLQKTQEKINNAKTDVVKESFDRLGRRQVQDIKNNRKKNILETMIYSISEAAMKNGQFKEIYTKNNVLDMDAIVENCTLIYTFLEMTNTSKMKKYDENIIKDLLNNLK